jgi:hypothetical protein
MASEKWSLMYELSLVGPCLMASTNVYCPGRRLTGSTDGLCEPCRKRQEIRDQLHALIKGNEKGAS